MRDITQVQRIKVESTFIWTCVDDPNVWSAMRRRQLILVRTQKGWATIKVDKSRFCDVQHWLINICPKWTCASTIHTCGRPCHGFRIVIWSWHNLNHISPRKTTLHFKPWTLAVTLVPWHLHCVTANGPLLSSLVEVLLGSTPRVSPWRAQFVFSSAVPDDLTIRCSIRERFLDQFK